MNIFNLKLKLKLKLKPFNLKEFDYYFWDFRPRVYRDKYADLTKLSILELILKDNIKYVYQYSTKITPDVS